MRVREAREDDAPGISEIMRAIYGPDYPYPQFYDVDGIRKMVLGEDTLVLVAEHPEFDQVVGTASVILEIGAFSDLVGEFGRLAVLPAARGRGVGSLLMQERLARVCDRLHVGLVDSRVTHPFSERIAQKNGFVPVGICPLRHRFNIRESTGILAQWFLHSLTLRRNNPRVIPEVHPLASVSLRNAGLPVDVVVDDSSPPFPHDHDFDLDVLETEGYSSLVRIERGRTSNRKVYGPVRLHYGFFKLRANQAEYMIARKGGRISGAVGYMRNDIERDVRIFELISIDDQAIQLLLSEVERRCREEWGIEYIEIDVAADAPRMQRTLIELGFVPAAYVPAWVFQNVERLDAVRMVRILVPLELGEIHLTPEMEEIAALVIEPIRAQQLVPMIQPVVRESVLLRGLNDEQTARLAMVAKVETFAPGDKIIVEGDWGDALYLIIEGKTDIEISGNGIVGSVGVGEALGEMGLLDDARHSATAVAKSEVRVARLKYEDLRSVVRCRPDIGVVIYGNLARGLGKKLLRTGHAAR